MRLIIPVIIIIILFTSSTYPQDIQKDVPIGKKIEAITFKGCSITRRAFMTEAARAYEKKTGIRINVIGGGATLGIRSTIAGDTEMGGTCRPPLPDRFNEEKGSYLTHVAWDALVFITHTSNPVNNITLNQAKDILLGRITNWKELGGPNKRIILVLRAQNPEEGEEYSGVGYMLRLMLFEGSEIEFSKNAIYVRDSEKVEEIIETTPYTFAVTGVSSAKKRGLKVLSLNGIEPTKGNIASGAYPLFRPLFIVTKGKPAGKVKDFIDWLLSKEGQKLISDEGTVNLEEGNELKKKFKFMDLR